MSVLRRLAGSLAAAAFGLAAVASGIDRNSDVWPQTASSLPDFAKASTWHAQAAQALADGDSALATELAAKGIGANPGDPRGPSLYATARLTAEDFAQASQAFSIADRTGLRTPLVQAYFFDQALAAGDGSQAARRLDILLLAHPSLAQIDYFFRALEGSQSGSRALAERVANEPAWASAYLTGFGSSDAVLAQRAAFLSRPASFDLGCDRIEPMLRALAERGQRAGAQRLAARQCPQRSASQAIFDPGFESLGEGSALGWRKHPSGDVRITQVGSSDRQVEMVNRSATTRLVLSQPIALDVGEYRIAASIAQARRDAVVATLGCGEPRRPSRESGSLAAGQLVQGQGCPDQQLGIWLRGGSGTVQIDNIRIEPVGVQAAPSPASNPL